MERLRFMSQDIGIRQCSIAKVRKGELLDGIVLMCCIW